ncbi:MAG: DegV family protein [Eubacterium sp.]|nr:DegV family protein [Eubacterium sp.]
METKEYKIIADGAADLGAQGARDNDVDVVPFYVSFDNETYRKEIVEVDIREFYQKMIDYPKVFPKTSMPSVQDYIDAFEPYAKAGIPVICICITAKFSGSYQSAVTAAGMIQEDYPAAVITVIDSTLNTVLEGMFVREAARMKKDGLSYEDTVERLLQMRETGRILFTVGGMSYLVHGGRVGKLMGLAASTLNIRPLITMKDGEIFPSGIARSRKKSRDKVLDLICTHFRESGEQAEQYAVNIGYGYDYEEAATFREQVARSLAACAAQQGQNAQTDADWKEKLEIHQIGATVGVHTGPYPIGVGILKKYEYILCNSSDHVLHIG